MERRKEGKETERRSVGKSEDREYARKNEGEGGMIVNKGEERKTSGGTKMRRGQKERMEGDEDGL